VLVSPLQHCVGPHQGEVDMRRSVGPLLLAVLLLLPLSASAQSPNRPSTLPAESWQAQSYLLGTTSEHGLDPRAVKPRAVASRIGKGGRREAVTLMIVGGAGILTGLLVDESIVTIAGAGVAGVGLYFYLR